MATLVTERRLPPAFGAVATAASSRPAPPVSPVSPASAATAIAPPTVASTTSAPPPAVPAAFVPTRLVLPAFGVTAPVVPVATAPGGVLDPPDDVATVGWWIAGAPAGAPTGTVVVVGHVDGPAGPGALYRLVHARPGDPVELSDGGGRVQRWAVSALQYAGKTRPLPSALFDAAGGPRLVVITCGGTFDRATDQYADNVVVVATPA